MKTTSRVPYALSVCAAAAMLAVGSGAGCSPNAALRYFRCVADVAL